MTDVAIFDDGEEHRVSKALAKAADQLRRGLWAFVEDGAGPFTGSAAYADERLNRVGQAEKAIQRVVRETVASTGATGFVSGLGGIAAMPVTVPAGLAGAAMLNARMVGSIAHLRGYSLRDPFVQQVILLVVAGESGTSAVKDVGVKIGRQFADRSLKKVSAETIQRINNKVGVTLLAKYGSKRSAMTLAKMVPVVGGVVGGTVDAAFTKAVAAAAKKAFPADNE